MSDSKLSRDIMYMNKHEHVKDEEKKKKNISTMLNVSDITSVKSIFKSQTIKKSAVLCA